jgi:hypothetical protein
MRTLWNGKKTSFSREFLSAKTDKRIKLEREAGSDGIAQLMKLSSFSQLASPSQFKNCYHPVGLTAIKLVTPQLRRREEGKRLGAMFFSVYLTTLPTAHTNRVQCRNISER